MFRSCKDNEKSNNFNKNLFDSKAGKLFFFFKAIVPMTEGAQNEHP